ncbi:dihydroorotate dehydrogenase (quinone) [Helicobacter cynogastricus]|uniref:dihydroorotate dehydrogenase (quinone) n=1 Tax=Helicobacter cynogastricus TaxID=329937 RepID=UPI000CF123F7|nr:dihydroorotate dehydrogenase (quinone) [Helicobacter cynogastricus]
MAKPYDTIKRFLFQLEPESAHMLAEQALRVLGCCSWLTRPYKHFMLENTILGMDMPNPICLAAGFDKNATMLKGLNQLGFGGVEVGTATPRPQYGNPKPRLFRFAKQESLQNAMGFNNKGVARLVRHLERVSPLACLVGVNVGKNKDTPLKNALKDYQQALQASLGVGNYYVFNLSSPNTPNLRDLQNNSFVGELFSMARGLTHKPLFLKVAPDMSTDALLSVCAGALEHGAHGIIATNTTMDYGLLPGAKSFGGISGRVLKAKSREVFKQIAQAFFGKAILVSVGGIDSAQEAYERIKMGAHFVQIFTAFIYQGPLICRQINQDIVELLQRDSLASLKEAIGIGR